VLVGAIAATDSPPNMPVGRVKYFDSHDVDRISGL
jgi:hypothetical protein